MLDFFLGVVAGIIVATMILNYVLRRLIQKLTDEVTIEFSKIDRLNPDIIGLEVEVDNKVIYCYNSENKQFVCQGSTIEEIRKAFKDRFPGKNAYITSGDPALIEQFEKELTKQ